MSNLPKCPKCGSEFTYDDGNKFVCPECAHEWSKEAAAETGDDALTVKDAHGNLLQDGDAVTVIKDLKVKGTSLVVKVGTKVKNIRLVEGDHNIDCKIDGVGPMKLKSEFVKKGMNWVSQHGESLFIYHLRISSRSRSIRFRVTPQHGLEVVIPEGYDPDQVPALLARKQRWIRAALERVASLRACHGPEAEWCLPARIELPAVDLAWAVTAKQGDNAARTAVRESGAGQLLISGAVDNEPVCRAALGRWLLRQAHQHLVPGLERVSHELGLPYTRALIRRQKTRWGSCSRDGTISLNAKLLFLSPETVNYVMIHELCHRVELNHSPRFWRLVERHCPEYRRIDAQRRELWKAVPRWAEAAAF